MAMLDEKQESGIAFLTDVMGETFGAAFRQSCSSGEFGSKVSLMAAGWAFHDAWQHSGITRKEKSLAIISALIATRQPLELKNHVKIGIVNGITVSELEALLIQLAPYVGFPCVASANTAIVEALREIGLLTDRTQAAEERDPR